jgi:predicted porin
LPAQFKIRRGGGQPGGKTSYPIGVAAHYKGDNWQFGAAYNTFKPNADINKKRQTYAVGVFYKFGEIKLSGHYYDRDNEPDGRSDKTLTLGAVYDFTNEIKLIGEAFHTRSKVGGQRGKRSAAILTAEYFFSKTTQSYIGVDYNRFSGASVPASAKASRLGLTVGLRHYF